MEWYPKTARDAAWATKGAIACFVGQVAIGFLIAFPQGFMEGWQRARDRENRPAWVRHDGPIKTAVTITEHPGDSDHHVLAAAEILKAGLRPHQSGEPADYHILVLTADELRWRLDEIITDPAISLKEKRHLAEDLGEIDEDDNFCFNRTIWDSDDPHDRPVSFSFVPATAPLSKVAHCLEVTIDNTISSDDYVIDNNQS